MTTGKCKHGEFELGKGCPECIADAIAERREAGIKPEQDEMEDGLNAEGLMEAKREIVKVKYYSETTEELSPREYTYYSNDRLKVGDIVIVPVRDTTGKAKVSAIDVPEAEIAAFKDKVKTIPAGAKGVITTAPPGPLGGVTGIVSPAGHVTILAEPTEIKWRTALRPGEDIEAHDWHNEAIKLCTYAACRFIRTLVDAQIATHDLSVISRLKKAMESKRKEKLAPAQAEVKAIQETYNYLMTPVLEAERITKSKQVAFLQEQERRRREQEEINRKRMEAAQAEMDLKGELSEPVNLVEVQQAPERVRTDQGTSSLVEHWVYEVIDLQAVSREYLVVDHAMLSAIAKTHHDRKPVAGIKFVNQPFLSTRAK